MAEGIRVALVGYGLAGKVFHAPLIGATPGLDLACIVSSDAAKVQADLLGMRVVPDLDSVLADGSIDLIVLATPDALHAPQALAALDAGKHVVIDKPFAPTLAQAQQVAARAAESGLTLTIFHNRRWDGDFLTARRLIEDGTLGEVMLFESHFDRWRPDVGDRWKDKREGGVWQDLGPHLVDQALQLFGMPDSLVADIASQKGGPAADYAHVILKYGARRVILHMGQMVQGHGLRFAVHGTGGSYHKQGSDPQEGQSKAGMRPTAAQWGVDEVAGTLTRIGADGEPEVEAVATERGNYGAFYAEVRDAVLGVGANPVPPQQAIDVMRILDAGQTSATEKRDVIV